MKELNIVVRNPITANSRLEIDGAVSVTLQNMGSNTVMLDGLVTIAPKTTFNLSIPSGVGDAVIFASFQVLFTGAGTNRLEVLEIFQDGVKFNHEFKSRNL